jgi:Mitochondrial protein Pet127
MRSQLDACDPRLPGSGVFDIKTRATIAIRKDPYNHEVGYMPSAINDAFNLSLGQCRLQDS